jgi:hypothetical protein
MRLINAKMNSSALSDIGRDDNFSHNDYDSYVGLCKFDGSNQQSIIIDDNPGLILGISLGIS